MSDQYWVLIIKSTYSSGMISMGAVRIDAAAAPAGKQPPFFYGWYIVAVSFLCWFAADAFGGYTIGLFIGPITRELGWSTFALTLGMTIRSSIGGFIGPVIGPVSDTRHGARVVMTVGVLVAGAAIMLISQVQEVWHYYVIYGVFGALGMVGFGGLVTNTVLAKWFIRKRGRAMGVATMGVSLGGAVFVQVAHFLISNYGWRSALLIQGVMVWILALVPVFFFVRRRPEDMGLLPDGDEVNSESLETENIDKAGAYYAGERTWTHREALSTGSLYLLIAAFNVGGLATSAVMIFYYPFLESRGFSGNVGATAMTIFAMTSAIVKIPWGLLAERIHARYCVIAGYAGCAFGLILLLSINNHIIPFLFAVVYGIGLGGNIVLRELVFAAYFGRTFLGTIRGVIMPLNLISIAGGPLLAAWLRDVTGDYRLSFTLFLLAFAVGAVFMILAKPPKPPGEKQ
jgi:MFS family permease